MAEKVSLHHYGVGTMFNGKTFSKVEAERKAREFIAQNKGEWVQLINPETGASIKIVR